MQEQGIARHVRLWASRFVRYSGGSPAKGKIVEKALKNVLSERCRLK